MAKSAPTTTDRPATAGEIVRERRLRLGWTQQEASNRAEVSLATWRLIETGGRPRYQALTGHRVARALGWPPSSLTDMLAGDVDGTDLLDEAVPADPAPAGPTNAQGSSQPAATPEGTPVPASFAHRWTQLTDEEQAMVSGFIEGLVARRSAVDDAG
jgi:transcriptional regulator with XRE-family HTH domain